MNLNKEINRDVGWSIVLSVLLIVAGILAIVVPQASGIAVTILFGWLLVFVAPPLCRTPGTRTATAAFSGEYFWASSISRQAPTCWCIPWRISSH